MSDKYLGTITSAGASTTNATTAAPFTVGTKQRLSIQPDAAVYVVTGLGSATSTAAAGVKVAADQLYDVWLFNEDTIAVLPVSGSANVKVFASTP